MLTPKTRLQKCTFDPRSIGPASWSASSETQLAVTMSRTIQCFPEFCQTQVMRTQRSDLMSLWALHPALQTCSLIPLQICGLAYLPAGECHLHLGCSPKQRSHSPETPRIAWNREAQSGDSGVLSFSFLPFPPPTSGTETYEDGTLPASQFVTKFYGSEIAIPLTTEAVNALLQGEALGSVAAPTHRHSHPYYLHIIDWTHHCSCICLYTHTPS